MKVVVVGGGFGGLKAAIELARLKVGEVTLISDKDYFLHHATLYSTVAGGDERESAIPIADTLKYYPGVRFVNDRIVKINSKAKKVSGAKSSYDYDVLILSVGMTKHLSGANGQKKYSYGTTSLQAAKSMQEDFHDLLVDGKKGIVNCVIVGGGMVGVEFAGALCDYTNRIKDAHGLTYVNAKLSLVELSDRVLPYASRSASRKASQLLRSKGVDLVTNQLAEKVGKSSLVLRGKKLDSDITIWTCGGRRHPLYSDHAEIFKLSKRGRVIVNQYMMAYPGIYVIGDSAETKSSGSAYGAINDARFVAKNLKRQVTGRGLRIKGRYRKPILSIPVGRFWAYTEYGGVYVSGFGGSMVRRLIELSSYCHFFPLSKAYVLWRKYRTSNEFCTLCRKQELN